MRKSGCLLTEGYQPEQKYYCPEVGSCVSKNREHNASKFLLTVRPPSSAGADPLRRPQLARHSYFHLEADADKQQHPPHLAHPLPAQHQGRGEERDCSLIAQFLLLQLLICPPPPAPAIFLRCFCHMQLIIIVATGYFFLYVDASWPFLSKIYIFEMLSF